MASPMMRMKPRYGALLPCCRIPVNQPETAPVPQQQEGGQQPGGPGRNRPAAIEQHENGGAEYGKIKDRSPEPLPLFPDIPRLFHGHG